MSLLMDRNYRAMRETLILFVCPHPAVWNMGMERYCDVNRANIALQETGKDVAMAPPPHSPHLSQ